MGDTVRTDEGSIDMPAGARPVLRPRRPTRWLCIAYAFPPINRSGTHRTLGFVKHLDRLGWAATVLTVDPRGESIDDSLNARVPSRTTIVRVPCPNLVGELKRLTDWRTFLRDSGTVDGRAPASASSRDDRLPRAAGTGIAGRLRDGWDWFSRFLQTPDSRTGWILPAICAGLRTVRRQKPNVVYSTSPYASAHLIAYVVSRLTRIPWVADFRDPWRGNPFGDSVRPSLDAWDALLERRVLHAADAIVCCTPTMTRLVRKRYPALSGRTSTILNGFDTDLFEGIRPERNATVEQIVLTHCGQFYGPRSPAVLFAALRRATQQSPQLAGKVRLDLIGPDDFDGRPLRTWAEESGVGGLVHVLGVKSHAETLAHMRGSDGLVLVGSQGAGADLQVPNKLFEYLGAQRAIIAACARSSPVCDILREAEAPGASCDPCDEQSLADLIVHAAAGRYREVPGAWSGVPRFERSHRADELHAVFESLRAKSGGRSNPQTTPTKPTFVDRRADGIVSGTRRGDRVPNQRLQVEQRMNEDGGDERAGALVGVTEEQAE